MRPKVNRINLVRIDNGKQNKPCSLNQPRMLRVKSSPQMEMVDSPII